MVSSNKKEGIIAVHQFDKRIKRHVELLENLHSNNARKILDFHNYLLSQRYAEATLEKYLVRLIHIY